MNILHHKLVVLVLPILILSQTPPVFSDETMEEPATVEEIPVVKHEDSAESVGIEEMAPENAGNVPAKDAHHKDPVRLYPNKNDPAIKYPSDRTDPVIQYPADRNDPVIKDY